MSAADKISALGPTHHFRFSEIATADVVATVIPNEYERIEEGFQGNHFIADAGSDPPESTLTTFTGPCDGDVVAFVTSMETGCDDYRAPRGAYQWTEDRTDQEEAPEKIPRADLGSSPFAGAFTLMFMGGQLRSQRMMIGTSDVIDADDEDGTNCPIASTLWFGTAQPTAVGFDGGSNGSWFTIGVNNLDSNPSSFAVTLGNGLSIGGIAGSSMGEPGYGNSKGLTVVTYDPSAAIEERMMIWVDGGWSYVTQWDGEGACPLEDVFEYLETQQADLFFATGWDPYGLLRYIVDSEGEYVLDGEGERIIEHIYPWHKSYGGVLSNVALFNEALTLEQLRLLWIDINNRDGLVDGCSVWMGLGPTARIVRTEDGDPADNMFVFDASTSTPAPGGADIVAWEWSVYDPSGYGGFGDVPAYGDVFSTGEVTDPVHLVRSDVYGMYVTIMLKVTDGDGLTGFAWNTFVPNNEDPSTIKGWSVGRIGW